MGQTRLGALIFLLLLAMGGFGVARIGAASAASGSSASSAPSTSPTAAPSSSASSAATAQDIQQILDQRVKDQPGVGIIAGVIDDGKTTIYMAGSSGTSRPLDSHTLFQIGSVTKTFTATILASMVLDGSVKLDDPVSKYLPATVRVPSRDGQHITLLNLATQHSGLPRLPTNLDAAGDNPYADYTIKDLYQFLGSYKLTRDPGQEFEYSNLGIGLLGDALANHARMPYAQLLGTRVLAPLGMRETAISMTPQLQGLLAAGHDADDNQVPLWTFRAIAPAGAIVSSASDMVKYLRANMLQGPLAKQCLFAQQPRATIPGDRIGLVWLTDDVTKSVWHNGATNGYQSEVAISPDHRMGAFVLTNGGLSPDDIAFHAIDPALPVANAPAVVQLDGATLDGYVGTYNGPEGLTFVIRRADAKLTAQLSKQPAFRIYASAKDRFFYKIVDAQIDFKRDTNKAVSALVLHQNGQNLIFTHPGMTSPAADTAVPSYPPVVTLDTSTLDGYVGTYASASGLEFSVTQREDGLFVELRGQAAAQVYPSAKDHFYYKIVDAQIDFERDGSGRVKDLVLHQNGRNITAVKVAQPSPAPRSQ